MAGDTAGVAFPLSQEDGLHFGLEELEIQNGRRWRARFLGQQLSSGRLVSQQRSHEQNQENDAHKPSCFRTRSNQAAPTWMTEARCEPGLPSWSPIIHPKAACAAAFSERVELISISGPSRTKMLTRR